MNIGEFANAIQTLVPDAYVHVTQELVFNRGMTTPIVHWSADVIVEGQTVDATAMTPEEVIAQLKAQLEKRAWLGAAE